MHLQTAIASFLISSGKIYRTAPTVSGANKSNTDASKQKLANSAATSSAVNFLEVVIYSIRLSNFPNRVRHDN